MPYPHLEDDRATWVELARLCADLSLLRFGERHGINGYREERRGSLSGINRAAHRKADAMVESSGEAVKRAKPDKPDTKTDTKPDASGKLEQAAREDSEDKRAAVIARHRTEWQNVGVLLNTAITERTRTGGDAVKASDMARFAKTAAEVTKLKQEGERKAWGLDDLADFDPTKMTDEELECFIRGRS